MVCGKTRKAKRREAVGPYAVADGAAAPEDAADGAARAIAIPRRGAAAAPQASNASIETNIGASLNAEQPEEESPAPGPTTLQ